MKTLRLTVILQQPKYTCLFVFITQQMMKPLACGMALIVFLQLIQSKIDLPIKSDRLCLSVLIVSVIGILVKSYIIQNELVLHRYGYNF